MKLTAWIFALALAASPAMAGAPDPVHLALARQVVALAFQGANFAGSSVRTAQSMTKVVTAQLGFDEAANTPPPPAPTFNADALRASFVVGINEIAPKYQDAVAMAYADTFTDAQLRANLAFFTSPEGQAAIADRKAFAARQDALPPDDPFEPAQTPAAYVETRGERSFYASPIGRTLKQHQAAIGKQVTQALTVLWPQAMQAAEADYCRHEACVAPEHKVFDGLAKIWDQDAWPRGH